jgi:hypothetical protein
LQALPALLNEPNGAGGAVFALQLRVPATETFVAQPDTVLQALEARVFLRMAGTFSHAAITTPLWVDHRCAAGGLFKAKPAVGLSDTRRPPLQR